MDFLVIKKDLKNAKKEAEKLKNVFTNTKFPKTKTFSEEMYQRFVTGCDPDVKEEMDETLEELERAVQRASRSAKK